ncbi:hypothetical protein FJT64_005333 [Amphibalanus amphitrite]|uniref:Uncharacterized protein n=1 Tax=Amphibalanus amphitrite TaxID=1232801 RepID=A0A6A4VLS8_AMPAM|nr:hypothetical protein FJT64_005333 [Amphibalanus amphitrite]
MATLEQLQRIRIILLILLIINTIMMIPIAICLEFYWTSINFLVYMGLAIALFVVTVQMRRILIQQTGIIGVVPAVVVMPPNRGAPAGPPPPGFEQQGTAGYPPAYGAPSAPAGSDAPPPYSQQGPWSTQQASTGYGQPAAYGQTAFAQPSPAGGQPFAAFNQPGQNSYWNASNTS